MKLKPFGPDDAFMCILFCSNFQTEKCLNKKITWWESLIS